MRSWRSLGRNGGSADRRAVAPDPSCYRPWHGSILLRINSAGEGNRFASFVSLADGTIAPRTTGPVAQTGIWQHVATPWDGACLQLWVDGRLRAGVFRGGRLGPNKGPILIGQGVKERLRDVRLYDRTLAAEEIRSHAGKPD